MIQIMVNGENVQIPDTMSVERVLDTVHVPPNYLAVEINGEVVPRQDYSTTNVTAGDHVEVVTLVGGG